MRLGVYMQRGKAKWGVIHPPKYALALSRKYGEIAPGARTATGMQFWDDVKPADIEAIQVNGLPVFNMLGQTYRRNAGKRVVRRRRTRSGRPTATRRAGPRKTRRKRPNGHKVRCRCVVCNPGIRRRRNVKVRKPASLSGQIPMFGEAIEIDPRQQLLIPTERERQRIAWEQWQNRKQLVIPGSRNPRKRIRILNLSASQYRALKSDPIGFDMDRLSLAADMRAKGITSTEFYYRGKLVVRVRASERNPRRRGVVRRSPTRRRNATGRPRGHKRSCRCVICARKRRRKAPARRRS